MIGEPERVLFEAERFKAKLFHSLAIVKKALDGAHRPYVAFSGGKDSLCVLALVERVGGDLPLVWSDDELEYPEVVEYMTRLQAVSQGQFIATLGWAEHAHWFRPWTDKPYWRDPLPGTLRINEEVDEWMGGQRYDLTFLGTRMDENRRRRDWLVQAGPLYRVNSGTGKRCCPIAEWTADDVWALIAGWRLPYCAVYDRLEQIGVPRRGQRVGPLPLARRAHLAEGWPDMLTRLEARYGKRWE